MKKFKVKTCVRNIQYLEYVFEVEAKNKKEAKSMVEDAELKGALDEFKVLSTSVVDEYFDDDEELEIDEDDVEEI